MYLTVFRSRTGGSLPLIQVASGINQARQVDTDSHGLVDLRYRSNFPQAYAAHRLAGRLARMQMLLRCLGISRGVRMDTLSAGRKIAT
jgi:hypothetical protein